MVELTWEMFVTISFVIPIMVYVLICLIGYKWRNRK